MGTDLKMLCYWASLGAAAGGLGGGLVGGVGGRFAMFILRLTSDYSVRGIRSDDGFVIGQFSLQDTSNLIFITAVMGSIVGLIITAGRPFFPARGMPFAWGVAGALTGGALLVHDDGVDFTLIEPRLLALSLFVLIPAAGTFVIAWLIELYPRFWWRNRKATAAASVAAVPVIIFFPVGILTVVVCGVWLLVLQMEGARKLHRWRPARIAAALVFAAIVALGLADLTGDTRSLL